MKHCPHCRENYSDEHENCFTCNVELVEGGLAEPSEEERAEALRRKKRGNPLIIAGLVGFVFCLCGAFVMYVHGQVNSVISIHEVVTYLQKNSREGAEADSDKPDPTVPKGVSVVSVPEGKSLLSNGGQLRTAEEAKAFQDNSGLEIPSFNPDEETLVYCPVAYYENVKGTSDGTEPKIFFATQEDEKVTIGIGRKPPGGYKKGSVLYDKGLELLLEASSTTERKQQYVVIGRLSKVSGRLSFVTTGQ